MRLIVSGWHGQIARALAEEALGASDIAAFAVGRPSLDIRDPRSIERAFADISPDLVINTAAYTAVDKAEAEPEAAFRLNRDGAGKFAGAAARHGIPIVHLSTHYVFDGAKAAPYVETDAAEPATVYGRSKLEGEEAVRHANPRHVILRTGWVYSAAGRNFFTRVREHAATSREALDVVADQRGSPTYAPHLAAAILDLARQILKSPPDQPEPWGVYHVTSPGCATWLAFAEEIGRQMAESGGARIVLRPTSSDRYQAENPNQAPRPGNAVLDCTKFERTFGLRLPDWPAGIAAALGRSYSPGAV